MSVLSELMIRAVESIQNVVDSNIGVDFLIVRKLSPTDVHRRIVEQEGQIMMQLESLQRLPVDFVDESCELGLDDLTPLSDE